MSGETICPILMVNPGCNGLCRKDGCAWWINEEDGCAVRKLATQNQLVDIVFSQEMSEDEATEALR